MDFYVLILTVVFIYLVVCKSFLSVLIIMFLDIIILLFLSNNTLTILVEYFGKEKSPRSPQIISAFVFCFPNVMKISCEGSRAVSVQR